jgi:hypothetical protein
MASIGCLKIVFPNSDTDEGGSKIIALERVAGLEMDSIRGRFLRVTAKPWGIV